MDKTLPIASQMLIFAYENKQCRTNISVPIALFPMKSCHVHLYAILCTMFHRNGLYRAEFPCKTIGKIHIDSPLNIPQNILLYPTPLNIPKNIVPYSNAVKFLRI